MRSKTIPPSPPISKTSISPPMRKSKPNSHASKPSIRQTLPKKTSRTSSPPSAARSPTISNPIKNPPQIPPNSARSDRSLPSGKPPPARNSPRKFPSDATPPITPAPFHTHTTAGTPAICSQTLSTSRTSISNATGIPIRSSCNPLCPSASSPPNSPSSPTRWSTTPSANRSTTSAITDPANGHPDSGIRSPSI